MDRGSSLLVRHCIISHTTTFLDDAIDLLLVRRRVARLYRVRCDAGLLSRSDLVTSSVQHDYLPVFLLNLLLRLLLLEEFHVGAG